MNGSQERKTEEPTQRRLRDARKDGEVAFSRDASTAVVIAAVIAALWLGRDAILARLSTLGRYALDYPSRLARPGDAADIGADMISRAVDVFQILASLTLPFVLIAFLAALVADVWQTRGLFAGRAVRPQFNRINPAEGFKQLFSLRNLVEFLKTLVKVVALGATLYSVIRWSLNTMVKLPSLSVDSIMSVSGVVFAVFFGSAIVILAIAAAFDLWWQRVEFIRQHRMTPEELKRERRDDLGDPHMRAERRRIAQQDVGESLLERTANASLVIVDPVREAAIAVRVDPGEEGAVWVLNKGLGLVAQAVVAIANESRIQVANDSALADRLIRGVSIDSDVDAESADAIRELIRQDSASIGGYRG